MKSSLHHRAALKTQCKWLARFSFARDTKSFLLASLVVLSGCGGSSSNSKTTQSSGQLSGNWQFSLSAPADGSFQGNPGSSCATSTTSPLCPGGFLLQNADGGVSGAVTYAVLLPASGGGTPTVCNSGSAPVSGSVSDQTVNLTIAAANQTFTLTGTLDPSGSTMMGTYTSTGGKGCGTAQTGLQWSARSVPPLTGPIQGTFHSTQNAMLRDQVFAVTGNLTQGENIGASNATVTGTLSFDGYPCLAGASVNGQVSGNSVILQIIAGNGLDVGQIGAPVGFTNPNPVTVLSSTAGEILQGVSGYDVSGCPGNTTDIGNVCLGLGSTTSCTQPLLFSPASLVFPLQLVGSLPTTQFVTLTNNSLSALTGLTISFIPNAGTTELFVGLSDFTGLPNFTEQDNCAASPGAPFTLNPQQSCIITVSFQPQQSCPWLPSTGLGGAAPSACPFPLNAALTVTSPTSTDNDTSVAIPITGTAFSAIEPSTPELDFGAEAVGERSTPQVLTFTNEGLNPVQILPGLGAPCSTPNKVLTLPRPAAPGEVAGLQVVIGTSIVPNNSTINYDCDSDPITKLPNFQLSNDGCSGTLLTPLTSCNVTVTYAPQPGTPLAPALDYFLELNTLECTGSLTTNCEIDSGRFPVELKANLPSPLRMIPAAGLNFGTVAKGQASAPMTITLFNDPKDPNAGVVNFTGNLLSSTNFSETDNCVGSLAPGSSCMVTVTFVPKGAGFKTGTLTIGYNSAQTQTIYLRGTGQ